LGFWIDIWPQSWGKIIFSTPSLTFHWFSALRHGDFSFKRQGEEDFFRDFFSYYICDQWQKLHIVGPLPIQFLTSDVIHYTLMVRVCEWRRVWMERCSVVDGKKHWPFNFPECVKLRWGREWNNRKVKMKLVYLQYCMNCCNMYVFSILACGLRFINKSSFFYVIQVKGNHGHYWASHYVIILCIWVVFMLNIINSYTE